MASAKFSPNRPLSHSLSELDSAGNLMWSKSIGRFSSGGEVVFAITEARDKEIAITGTSNSSDFSDNKNFLLKTDSSGNILWAKTYNIEGQLSASYDARYSVVATSIFFTTISKYELNIFPNPVSKLLSLINFVFTKKIITDLLGKIVLRSKSSEQLKQEQIIDVSNLISGIYFVRAGSGVRCFVKE